MSLQVFMWKLMLFYCCLRQSHGPVVMLRLIKRLVRMRKQCIQRIDVV